MVGVENFWAPHEKNVLHAIAYALYIVTEFSLIPHTIWIIIILLCNFRVFFIQIISSHYYFECFALLVYTLTFNVNLQRKNRIVMRYIWRLTIISSFVTVLASYLPTPMDINALFAIIFNIHEYLLCTSLRI